MKLVILCLLLSIAIPVFIQRFQSGIVSLKNVLRVKRFPQKTLLNASLLMFAEDGDLLDVLQTIRTVEDRWNKRFHYPWTIFSSKEVSPFFIESTSSVASGNCEYVQWDSTEYLETGLKDDIYYLEQSGKLSDEGVNYSRSGSFHRYQEWILHTLLYHPQLRFDYVWRLEPGVRFNCEENSDLFHEMEQNNATLGFTNHVCETRHTGILELEQALDKYEQEWIPDRPRQAWEYFNEDVYCKYWPYNEIIALRKFRENSSLVQLTQHLLNEGGIYYHRWTESDILSLVLKVYDSPTLHLSTIGYLFRPDANHCPDIESGRCACYIEV
ncbi:mannosyltransferase [Schizosaccharomyces cryophilus OY26]|uniref:Mannosyltransferase n=1 Tax=Schizosaccharomyces cryophilus (strain OY26 / ATCC MYA-4695 / CBS 11777 / NBRC 106824 / NRRL Y48691) TaxID=653667 RepID=S9VWQ0_SCHCR|nr:mannosyltransferase [Schizosaccharomyces cryophilus OY26]EPY52078.1 mannosyltransferase [Schizosaccharomyces cryophilus OY26]